MIALGTYMKTYKVGDIVDIKANGAVQKGVRFSSQTQSILFCSRENKNYSLKRRRERRRQ